MAQKYALYRLEKVVGKKEYIPYPVSGKGVSLKEAKRHLAIEYEDFPDGPLWYSPKIDEFVTYEIGDRIMFVPNDILNKYGDLVCIGVYRRYPIFYIDEYPNPYSYYKLRVSRREGFSLEGVR